MLELQHTHFVFLLNVLQIPLPWFLEACIPDLAQLLVTNKKMATLQSDHVAGETISEVQTLGTTEEPSLLTDRGQWSVYSNTLLTSSLIAPPLPSPPVPLPDLSPVSL